MRSETINGILIVLLDEDGVVLMDEQSALDLMANIRYEMDCDRVIIKKEAVADDFFVLSTGIAGGILQKFINYRMKLAIVGDFSGYTSKALKDFIYECNCGKDIFFVSTEEEAISKLSKA